uniref:Uncharacterized protein n=2 Tax=unclassified Kuravirus TaxID=1054967 RepID=A0AAU6NTY1_9CAUD
MKTLWTLGCQDDDGYFWTWKRFPKKPTPDNPALDCASDEDAKKLVNGEKVWSPDNEVQHSLTEREFS